MCFAPISAIVDGRIATIGAKLGAGRREIDADGRIVTPGGVDSHCHIEQRSSIGVMTADDFFTATRSAACGGTTTVIPFAAQHRGMSLRQVVKDYHACAEPKAAIDYAFHLIISDPTRAGHRPGAAGPDQGRLHVVQDLHHLRRCSSSTTGRSSKCCRWPGASARWSWCMPRTTT